MELQTPRLVIAAAQSGAGKTTVATGLMAALRRRGLQVQPYKVGPDYIDPTYHTAATGRISRNLDGWMLSEERLLPLVAGSIAGADVALVEGVMGLFDGAGATVEAGSTAQMAKWLSAPVLLVMDARGMARSAAAVLQGLKAFDPAIQLTGVIFNNVGSESHYRLLCEVVRTYVKGVEPVGYLPRQAPIKAPERHLGLVPSYEHAHIAAYLDALADLISKTVDLDAVLALAAAARPLSIPAPSSAPNSAPSPALSSAPEAGPPVRIGIARDAAFHFYYEDGLDLLRAMGAELVPFSPLHDSALPESLDALYLGGGFPEVYRRELAANAAMRHAVAEAIAEGRPVYAECGGLMFLTEAIVDEAGEAWPMVGAIPIKARMQKKLASLGYVTAVSEGDTLLTLHGETLRGHEFHWSIVDEHPPGWPPAFSATTRRGGTRPEGFYRKNLLASYVHVHFAANPQAAERLLKAARDYQQAKQEVTTA